MRNEGIGIDVPYMPLGQDQEGVPDLFPELFPWDFQIDEIQFPDRISKIQCRGQDLKEFTTRTMVLNRDESAIALCLNFARQADLSDISIRLKVRRAIETKNCYNGFVELDPATIKFHQHPTYPTKINLFANLSKVVKEAIPNDVYKLSRNDKNKNNFFLRVEVNFSDGTIKEQNTRHFMVQGSNTSSSGVKRRRPDPLEYDSGVCSSASSPLSSASSPGSGAFDPHRSGAFLNAQNAVFEYLKAEHGEFDNLDFKVIKSGNGDIAYHFELKGQDGETEYNPGEVIGFTTEGRNVAIVKLTSSYAKEVFLKGVVTESQYLEANKPRDENVITATICMLGIVPVQTIGPVYPGDGLFASKDMPGIAMPEDYVADKRNETAIGMSLEKYDCPDDEIHETKALVSILGGAVQEHVKREMETMKESLIVNIVDSSKKSKIRNFIIAGFLVVFSIAVGVWLYQRYGIGTMYQRVMCRRGSTGWSEYWYWLQGHTYRGVRFEDCNAVWEKATVDRRFYKRPRKVRVGEMHEKCLNGTYHYYINLDSCTGVLNPGAVYMFAVDDKCTKLFRFDEVLGEWNADKRVCASPRGNLICSHVPDRIQQHYDPNAKCKYNKTHHHGIDEM